MEARNFTIIKVCDLQSGVSQSGNAWTSREIIIKDENQQFGDVIACRLRDDNARNFSLKVGDHVNASLGFTTREYTDRNGQARLSTEITCWKTEEVNN